MREKREKERDEDSIRIGKEECIGKGEITRKEEKKMMNVGGEKDLEGNESETEGKAKIGKTEVTGKGKAKQ